MRLLRLKAGIGEYEEQPEGECDEASSFRFFCLENRIFASKTGILELTKIRSVLYNEKAVFSTGSP